MGINSLKDVIRTIEANGKQKNELDSLPAHVKQVSEVLEQCVVQLKQDFSL